MKIKVSFFGVLMLLSLIFTHAYLSLAAIIAAFFHELGHFAVAHFCNVSVEELKLDIFGATIKLKKELCSYKKEAVIALGGPAVNVLIFGVLLFFKSSLSGFVGLFAVASLFLGILNLLPIENFDGGRIIYCLLIDKVDFPIAYRISQTLSLICLIFLWMLSVYLILRVSASLSMFVFSFSLLCRTFVKKESEE